ncbi:hypothetical protein PI124_g7633 [Phytophthora idaei]|nr:hypothetical protein PI125_g7424 [Phytophthora idaei]KAG3160406.1 hypothetical protein PI126_g6921 [Phytophthora idaei]KAG3247687.1 hypothetical protein PI124_g7633 [Phytophthora idaei]
MSQFDEWWHNLRQGQTVIPPPRSSGSSGHHDNSEGGEGADGGALEVLAPLIAVAVDSPGVGENVQNTKSKNWEKSHFLPDWEIKQKLEPASGLLTGVGVVFN